MIISDSIKCTDFPCSDIDSSCYIVPEIEVNPDNVSIVMISECAPEDSKDYFYNSNDSLFEKTTVQAFVNAGVKVSNIQEIVNLGIYLTTAIKCRKTGYVIKTNTIKECSGILEKEISLFPNIKAFLLMVDTAIKSINYLAKKTGENRVIPAGSTYKIRGKKYFFKGRRVFPSYLQAGPSFYIEKSKRRMITEDISEAITFLGSSPN